MLIARTWRARPDGEIDILGVFDRVVLPGPPFRPKLIVPAKGQFDPTEVGESKTVILRATRTDDGATWDAVTSVYRVPELRRAIEITPYIEFRLDVNLVRQGEYEFELLIDSRPTARDWLVVAQE